MKIGDLVRHKILRKTRTFGIIIEMKPSNEYRWDVYKVYWGCIQEEEYWLSSYEIEVTNESG